MDNSGSLLSEIICKAEDELIAAAESLLNKYPDRRVFAFYGEMGAGKTSLIKILCSLLGCIDIVSSPTFSIVNVYKTEDFNQLFHFDLYRLKSVEELYDIGYEDYFYSNSYCFIEWPDKFGNLLPESHVKVFIDVDSFNEKRTIRF